MGEDNQSSGDNQSSKDTELSYAAQKAIRRYMIWMGLPLFASVTAIGGLFGYGFALTIEANKQNSIAANKIGEADAVKTGVQTAFSEISKIIREANETKSKAETAAGQATKASISADKAAIEAKTNSSKVALQIKEALSLLSSVSAANKKLETTLDSVQKEIASVAVDREAARDAAQQADRAATTAANNAIFAKMTEIRNLVGQASNRVDEARNAALSSKSAANKAIELNMQEILRLTDNANESSKAAAKYAREIQNSISRIRVDHKQCHDSTPKGIHDAKGAPAISECKKDNYVAVSFIIHKNQSDFHLRCCKIIY